MNGSVEVMVRAEMCQQTLVVVNQPVMPMVDRHVLGDLDGFLREFLHDRCIPRGFFTAARPVSVPDRRL